MKHKIEVKINKLSDSPKCKAIAEVVIDGDLVIHGIRVIEQTRTIVAMPSRVSEKAGKGKEYLDIVHPINSDFRMAIENEVLFAYNGERDKEEKEYYEKLLFS